EEAPELRGAIAARQLAAQRRLEPSEIARAQRLALLVGGRRPRERVDERPPARARASGRVRRLELRRARLEVEAAPLVRRLARGRALGGALVRGDLRRHLARLEH